MAKIGIGVTTYNRPECLKEWICKIGEFTPDSNDIIIHIAQDTDEDRRGVAYRKNECLRALKHCDYVFLFDDDCFPIKDGWVEFFINSKFDHLLFLSEKIHGNSISIGGVKFFANCGGVFMYMKKEAIEKVGAFNEKFEKYGFEHAEYSIRIIGRADAYPMIKGTDQYIFSHDYSTPNHKSSITDEEKKECIKNNWDKFFGRNIENIYLPL